MLDSLFSLRRLEKLSYRKQENMESTVSVHGPIGDPDVDSPTLSITEAVCAF